MEGTGKGWDRGKREDGGKGGNGGRGVKEERQGGVGNLAPMVISKSRRTFLLDPETCLQALQTLFLLLVLLLVLRLFHFTTDRRQTSHTLS